MESKKSAACRKSRFGFFNKLTAGAAIGSARCVCFFGGAVYGESGKPRPWHHFILWGATTSARQTTP